MKIIKKVMDGLVNKFGERDELNFLPKNYKMRKVYDAERLVVGKLAYISNDVSEFGPVVKKTSQNYIFEPIIVDEVIKYQEVFTGFIVGDNEEKYFNLPWVFDVRKLPEISEDYEEAKIAKFGMLLTLNEVNSQTSKHRVNNILDKRKLK